MKVAAAALGLAQTPHWRHKHQLQLQASATVATSTAMVAVAVVGDLACALLELQLCAVSSSTVSATLPPPLLLGSVEGVAGRGGCCVASDTRVGGGAKEVAGEGVGVGVGEGVTGGVGGSTNALPLTSMSEKLVGLPVEEEAEKSGSAPPTVSPYAVLHALERHVATVPVTAPVGGTLCAEARRAA